MTTFVFSDFNRTTLAAAIGPLATSLTVSPGTGAQFPSPAAGEEFALVLTDVATRTNFEIVYCTARATDVLTVVRAQEGTSARSWSIGDLAWNGITSGQAASFVQKPLPGTSGRLISVQVFAASGTYVPSVGLGMAIIECQGGGASGGGTQVTSGGQAASGGGGGAGAYAKGQFLAATIGAGQTVTVGVAVPGNLGANGTNGNASSVGSLITAPGGLAGIVGPATTSFVSGTAGGAQSSAPTGGNIVSQIGSGGGGGIVYAATNFNGGLGARSQFGGGGETRANGDGGQATNPGSGGGGAQEGSSVAAKTGGDGAAGLVIIWEYTA